MSFLLRLRDRWLIEKVIFYGTQAQHSLRAIVDTNIPAFEDERDSHDLSRAKECHFYGFLANRFHVRP
jgi:hypothetical protein